MNILGALLIFLGIYLLYMGIILMGLHDTDIKKHREFLKNPTRSIHEETKLLLSKSWNRNHP